MDGGGTSEQRVESDSKGIELFLRDSELESEPMTYEDELLCLMISGSINYFVIQVMFTIPNSEEAPKH